MRTIFAVALFALLCVESACSKKNDASPTTISPSDVVGTWTGSYKINGGGQGGGLLDPTFTADGKVNSTNFSNGTWKLVNGEITIDFSVSSNVIFKGTVESTNPLKLSGTWLSTNNSVTGTWNSTKQ